MKIKTHIKTPKETLKITIPLSLMALAILIQIKSLPLSIGIFSILNIIPILLKHIYPKYKQKKRTRKIEKQLVPCLYHASSIAAFKTTEKVLKTLSEGQGELSKEFKRTHKEIKTGSSVKKALENMKNRTKSTLLKRTIEIMITSHESGSNLSKSLKEIAEEIIHLHKLKRKRNTATTIEKYTLLFAGGIIVPTLLGSLISVITSLELTAITELGLGLSQEVREAVKNNSIQGNQIYIAIYSIMASFFVAYQEKEIEKGLIYTTILLPLSIGLFNLAKSINLLTLF